MRIRNKHAAVILAGASVVTFGSGQPVHAALLAWDSSGASPAAPVDGPGTWDTSSLLWTNGSADVAWPNDTVSIAVFGDGSGAAGTVALGTAITANGLTFNAPGSGNYTIAGGGSNTLALGGTTPTITVAGGQLPTISAAIVGTAGLTVAQTGTGTGELALSGTNPYTGGTSIGANAQVDWTLTANLGVAASGVVLNGGTINYAGNTGSSPTFTHVITVGAAGGTINTQTLGGNGKFILASGGGLAGSAGGALVKSGGGWVTINAAAASGSNFTTAINGGVVELGSTTGLGFGAVTINTGGELSSNTTAAIANPINVNGGTLSADFYNASSTLTGVYSGPVAFGAGYTSSIRLGDFYQNQPYNVSITGPISGGGTVNLINSTGGASTGQVLTLTGNNTAFTGTINIDAGHTVNFGTASSTSANTAFPGNGKVGVTSSASQLAVLGFSDTATGTNPSPLISVTDNTAVYGGVFAYSGGAYNANLNLATFGDGKWFLGSLGGGSYYGSALTPGFDGSGNPLYRLGGGGSNLNIFPVLKDAANSSNVTLAASVQIGDPRLGGGGSIKFEMPMTYTGNTSIVNGTLSFGSTGGLPVTTLVTFGAPANTTNGTAASNGTLDLAGLNTPVGGLAVASGATAGSQIITNSSTTANSILTVDTSNFASTFAGIIKNGTSKSIGLTVQGSVPGNALTLTGADLYTGATTVNGGTLLVNGSLANSAVTVNAGGTIGGLGTLAGTLSSGGHLSPGSGGVGLFTVSNAVTLASGSYLDVDLNTANAVGPTGGDDLLAVNGTLTLNPNLSLDVNSGAAFGSGTYELSSFTTLTDNSAGFSGWTINGLPAGDTANFSLTGTALNLVVTAAVPEPASTVAILFTAASLLARRRRPNKAD